MGEQHLDALSLVPRALDGFGHSKPASDIASVFVDATRDFCALVPVGNIAPFRQKRGPTPWASPMVGQMTHNGGATWTPISGPLANERYDPDHYKSLLEK